MINCDPLPKAPTVDKPHIINVYLLTVLFPFSSIVIEAIRSDGRISVDVIQKWFLFFAVGIRFLIAGIRQAARVKFRAGEIFHIERRKCCPVIKELGFANLSFGMIAVVSLFIPSWRNVIAFGSCLYYGAAAFSALLKRPEEVHHLFLLFSNICIFLVLILLLL